MRRRAAQVTAGGRWSDELPPPVRRNLRWFWWDGVFAQASDTIILSFLSLFLLALGASRAQIGLLSALSSLSAALLVLPGAALVERWGHRKRVCLLSGGGVSRLMLLFLALAPLLLRAPAVVYLVIALAVIRDAFGNLALPAWTSLTADVVPLQWRGRYFGSRNLAMGGVGILVTYLAGVVITAAGSPAGYQWVLGAAFIFGLISTFSFSRIAEPPFQRVKPAEKGEGVRLLLRELRGQPLFVALCAVTALWNLSLNVAGPFFNIYMVEQLRATATVVGVLNGLSGLAALPAQRVFGVLADRWGPRRVQMITGLLIPLLPFAWALTRLPWHVVPINLAGGFLWAGYSLASFNFLLEVMPEGRRALYTALYQIVVTASLAGGAALGGLVATQWGYAAVFILSGAGRLIAALLFARFVRLPRQMIKAGP